MVRLPTAVRLSPCAILLVLIASCGGGGADLPTGGGPDGVASLVLQVPTPSLQVGSTMQLSVAVRDGSGAILPAPPAATFSSSDTGRATVGSDGVVTGAGAGPVTITVTASLNGETLTASTTITVVAPAPPGIARVSTPGVTFAPATVTIAEGDSVRWEFSGATHNVTFLGTAPAGGDIGDQAPGNVVSRTFAAAGTYDYECTRHSGMAGSVVVQTAAAPVFSALTLAPAAPSLPVGGTLQLVATARDQAGNAMAGLPAPVFTSSAAQFVTVSGTGMVTGVAAGSATVSASVTSAGVTHSATVVVTVTQPPPSGTTVTTPNLTFAPPTLSVQQGATVTWQFSGSTHNVTFLAALPAGGNIGDQAPGTSASRTFSTPGTYDYECTRHSGMVGTVIVQGNAAPVFTAVTVSPASLTLAPAATGQLTATGRDQFGNAMPGLPAPGFTTSAPAIATVSASGVVTATGPGTATITASITSAGVTRTATAQVTVSQAPPSGTTVTTPNLTFAPPTLSVQQGATVTWQFSGSTHNVTFLAALPAGGNIGDQAPGTSASRTFSTAGTYDYECTRHSGMVGSIVVQAAGGSVFTSVTVSPAAPNLTVGGTAQLTVTPRDQAGNAMSGLPPATFSSGNTQVATVNASGVVTGQAAGTALITASITSAGTTRAATATVTVSAPGGGAVTVTTPNLTFSPPSVTIPVGGTVTWQFSGSTHNVTFLGASPTGGSIGDTSPGGSASRTFSTPGSYSYECTRHNGMTGTVVVQGGSGPPVFTAIRITPQSGVVPIGSTLQMVAEPLDQFGAPMAGLGQPTFTSGNTSRATVTAGGLVRGVSAGSVSITATLTHQGTTKTASAAVLVSSGNEPTVTTTADEFSPDDIQVAPGETVIFEFAVATHNVTFEEEAPPGGNIPDTAPGNAVARTFTVAGDYDYECTIHKGMTGRVRVR